MKQLFLAIFLLISIVMACTSHPNEKASKIGKTPTQPSNTTTKKSPTITSHSLKGQLYFFAPNLDKTNCGPAGACDCCTWNILFPTDTSFIMLDYCEANCTYYKGTYIYDGSLLSLRFDQLSVSEEFNGFKADQKTEDYAYTVDHNAPTVLNFKRQQCNGQPIFKGNNQYADYGVIDRERNYFQLMRSMKKNGVWKLLKLK